MGIELGCRDQKECTPVVQRSQFNCMELISQASGEASGDMILVLMEPVSTMGVAPMCSIIYTVCYTVAI